MGDMAGELDDSEVNFERVGKELFAGGISGVFGVIVGLPFDLIKVRMQVNPDLYRSGISCFIKTVKTDGFFSLYRGMMAPVLSQSPINAVLFASEAAAIRVLEPNIPKAQQSSTSHIMAGAFAGLVQCTVLVPADRVKCLVQADGVSNAGGARQYKGTLDCAKQVLKNEGIGGFYRGFVATASREIPSLGIYFTTYKYVSSVMRSIDSPYLNQTVGTVLAGGTAGAASWLVVYPLDVIKTTIQTSAETLPNSIAGVAKFLYKKHGYRVFFKGLGTTVARAFPVNGITFAVYEKLKVAMDL